MNESIILHVFSHLITIHLSAFEVLLVPAPHPHTLHSNQRDLPPEYLEYGPRTLPRQP
jgi:hypothetical protein